MIVAAVWIYLSEGLTDDDDDDDDDDFKLNYL